MSLKCWNDGSCCFWLGEPADPSSGGDWGVCSAGSFWLGDPLRAGIVNSRSRGEVANESDWGCPFAIDPCRSTLGAGDDVWSDEEPVGGDRESTPLVLDRTPFVFDPADEHCDSRISERSAL
jgi:hypothetical protein